MLKQARAFGLGLLLATQNPVDVDYKALSNAGTWFIGKLQTEQDKNRLLDGLESAAGGFPRSIFDKLISSLGKRVFVLHNIHAKQPELLQTRWTMNFLAGPLTRNQIPTLVKLTDADTARAAQTQPTVALLGDANAESNLRSAHATSFCSHSIFEYQATHPSLDSRILLATELQLTRSLLCRATADAHGGDDRRRHLSSHLVGLGRSPHPRPQAWRG
jgi:hypothetical protein